MSDAWMGPVFLLVVVGGFLALVARRLGRESRDRLVQIDGWSAGWRTAFDAETRRAHDMAERERAEAATRLEAILGTTPAPPSPVTLAIYREDSSGPPVELARVRLPAAHTPEHVDRAIAAFTEVGRQLGAV